MAEDERRLLLDIPRHHIAGAYAAGPRFDKCVAGTGFRDRTLLDTDIVKRIKPCDLQ
jgi:hypothetical protein